MCVWYGRAASYCNRTRQTIGVVSALVEVQTSGVERPTTDPILGLRTRDAEYACGVVLSRRSVVTRRARARGLPPPRDGTGRPGGHANGQIGRASVRDFGTVLQRALHRAREHRGPRDVPRSVPPCTRRVKFKVSNVCARATLPSPSPSRRPLSRAETPHGDTRIGVTGGPLTSLHTCRLRNHHHHHFVSLPRLSFVLVPSFI